MDGSLGGVATVYVTSTLGANPQSSGTTTCNIGVPNAPFITAGTETAPVANGSTFDGEPIQVQCAVNSTGGNSYDVNLQVTEGPNGGVGGIAIAAR